MKFFIVNNLIFVRFKFSSFCAKITARLEISLAGGTVDTSSWAILMERKVGICMIWEVWIFFISKDVVFFEDQIPFAHGVKFDGTLGEITSLVDDQYESRNELQDRHIAENPNVMIGGVKYH